MIDYGLPRDVNNILIVRLGAMGDILHALPAAIALRRSFPSARMVWAVEEKWAPLLERNGIVDDVVLFHRHRPGTWNKTRRALRAYRFDLAVDFQGLIKSALVAHFARPERIAGFDAGFARERAASWFYSTCVRPKSVHVVDQALELAAGAGADRGQVEACARVFPLPSGAPEGTLPESPFVFACPLAGWTSKQWPLENYRQLAGMVRTRLGMPLVINGAPGSLPDVPWAIRHESGIPGLIDATRRAALVVGVDSGPLHLAAALGKSGAAIFGPTDPARNGPRGGDFEVFRIAGVKTTHRRGDTIDPSMQAITPEQVFAALASRIGCHA
ncbi:MAG TPA: glycosyltransferase family 9 protein [Bryobacteraceae bacterium]|nr:glycosyltransferase family 9 protein [Bryobacteraceae bacterium]